MLQACDREIVVYSLDEILPESELSAGEFAVFSSVFIVSSCGMQHEEVSFLGLLGVWYLTRPTGFLVQGLIDNFTQNWTGESPVLYPVYTLMSFK